MTDSTQPVASHFIDGRYVEDVAGEVIATVHAATPGIVDQALDAAKAAIEHYSQIKSVYVAVGALEAPFCASRRSHHRGAL